MEMRTHEVAKRLTIDLKTKRKVRAPHLYEYAKRLHVHGNYESSNGLYSYKWTEQQYQQLKNIFEE